MDFSVFHTDQPDQARRERGRLKKARSFPGNTGCRMAPARYTHDEAGYCFFSLPRPGLPYSGVPLRPLSLYLTNSCFMGFPLCSALFSFIHPGGFLPFFTGCCSLTHLDEPFDEKSQLTQLF
jgi:hypothetical protein